MSECPTCKGKGLLPFIKNGRVIPNAWIDCPACYQERTREHYIPVTPSDFDFPCSNTFRGFYHEEFGGGDPANHGNYRTLTDLTEIEDRLNDLEAEIARPGSIPRRYTEELKQIKGQMLYLQGKINKQHVTTRSRYNRARQITESGQSPGREDITDRLYR